MKLPTITKKRQTKFDCNEKKFRQNYLVVQTRLKPKAETVRKEKWWFSKYVVSYDKNTKDQESKPLPFGLKYIPNEIIKIFVQIRKSRTRK